MTASPSPVAPIFLTLEEAAAAVRVSPETFLAEVAAGWWPPPITRGAKGSKRTWHRETLEAAARRLASGPAPAVAPPPDQDNKRTGDGLSDADRAIVERLRGAKAQDQPQRRHAKAA